jgi:ubiquinone biosynthesis protein COQ9
MLEPMTANMLDETTPKGRIIAAALRLAAVSPWKDISLLDIAEESRLTLTDVRAEVGGKPDIVRGFVRAVDDALLRQVKRPQEGQSTRDALFEVIMARLDLLEPHKAAVRSMIEGADPDLRLLGGALSSQHWMLSAAGVDAEGARGAVRTLGLATLYASVLRTWLDDSDPGLARTMAALDRRLRRGERNLEMVESVCGALTGTARRFGELLGGLQLRTSKPAGEEGSRSG